MVHLVNERAQRQDRKEIHAESHRGEPDEGAHVAPNDHLIQMSDVRRTLPLLELFAQFFDVGSESIEVEGREPLVAGSEFVGLRMGGLRTLRRDAHDYNTTRRVWTSVDAVVGRSCMLTSLARCCCCRAAVVGLEQLEERIVVVHPVSSSSLERCPWRSELKPKLVNDRSGRSAM